MLITGLGLLAISFTLSIYLKTNPPYYRWRKYLILLVELSIVLIYLLSTRTSMNPALSDTTPFALFILLIVLAGLRLSPALVAFTGFFSGVFFVVAMQLAHFPPNILYPILLTGLITFIVITTTVTYVVASLVKNKELYYAAQRHSEEIETLRQASAIIAATLDPNEAAERILQQLVRVLPYDNALLLQLESGQLKMIAEQHLPPPAATNPPQLDNVKTLITALQYIQHPLILNESTDDPRLTDWFDRRVPHNVMLVPLITRGHAIGFIFLDRHHAMRYTESDAVLAQTFAYQAAVAIDNARLFAEVQTLALTDPLTGLPNRRYFNELASQEIKRAKRFDEPLSFIIFDVDHFKKVNDTHGHAVGDRVLMTIAAHCRKVLREIDHVGRYGGEEFVIALPRSDIETARVVAERLRHCVADTPVRVDEIEFQITISVGVASLQSKQDDLKTLLERADAAMYQAKQAGRNRVAVG